MIMVQLTLFLPSTDNKSSLYALYNDMGLTYELVGVLL